MPDIVTSQLPLSLALIQEAAATPAADGGWVSGEYLVNPFVLGILFCFGYSTVALVRYVRGLRRQRAALKRVRDNYERVELDEERDPEVVRDDLLRGVEVDTLVAQRVGELHRISVGSGEFDHMALAEVLAAREGAKISIARYVASVLVLLGLCGAVWGLSGMVFQMGPALKQVQDQLAAAERPAADAKDAPEETAPIQKSFETLIHIMSDSLANTRSAFYASLTGIMASILLLLFNWRVSRQQVEFLAALEDLTATRLIPAFCPPREAAELARAVETFKQGSNFLVRLSNDLDGKVAQVGTSLDSLFAIVRKFGEGAEAIHGGQERVYQAQAELLGVVAEFRDFMSRTESKQSDSTQHVDRVAAAVQESNENLGRAVSAWQRRHEDLLQLIQANDEKASREAERVRALALEGIREIAGLVRSSFVEQVGALKEQALELLTKQHEGNEGHLDRLVERQGEFITTLRQAVEESNGHRELLDGMSRAMEQERAQFTERLQHVLTRNDEALREVLGEQRRMLDVSGMRRVEERLEAFVASSQAEFSSQLRRQESLDHQLARLGAQAGRLTGIIRLLAGVATVAVPVFAALAVMFTFDLRPTTVWAQLVTLLGIAGAVVFVAWFLRRDG